MDNRAKTTRVLQAICLECGLCCNGDLFADVRLRAADSGGRLAQLKRLHFAPDQNPEREVKRLLQPCGFLEGCTCRVYGERPVYCRQFECAVIRQLKAGRALWTSAPSQLSEAAARRAVLKARRLSAKAKALLERLGNTDLGRPLATRFRQTARRLEGGSATPEQARLFGELTRAMHEFHWFVTRHIHPGPIG